jgi:hypothetical protein
MWDGARNARYAHGGKVTRLERAMYTRDRHKLAIGGTG